MEKGEHPSPIHHGHVIRGTGSRPPRENGGRRSTDSLPSATFTKKFVVVAVAVINALYMVSEALFFGHNFCP